jgi:DNA-binding Xre family transcriptional regulator
MANDESLSDQAAEEIRAMLARRRMSGRKLAEQLRVSHTWVSQRLTGQQEIGLNELARIADALGIPFFDLLPADRAISTVRTGGRVLRVVGSETTNELSPTTARSHSGDGPPTRGPGRKPKPRTIAPPDTRPKGQPGGVDTGSKTRRPVRTSDPHNRLAA